MRRKFADELDYNLPESVLIERQIALQSLMPSDRYYWDDERIDKVEAKRLARERMYPHEERDDD